MTADLSRLSDGERRVLALLAAGHTAKSAAAATGLSVNAVNERLREARRKTGVGSSRELARLVGPQENRDEEIGGASRRTPGDPAPVPARHPVRRRRPGALVLIIITAATAAAIGWFAWRSESVETSAARVDAVLGTLPKERHVFRERLLKERREPAWADVSEAKLRALYRRVPARRALTVTCRSTVCEVVVDIPSKEMMSLGLAQNLPSEAPLDFDLLPVDLALAERDPDTVTIVAYWLRHSF